MSEESNTMNFGEFSYKFLFTITKQVVHIGWVWWLFIPFFTSIDKCINLQ